MYPWLVEILARWRREGRRPSRVSGQGAASLLRSSHVRETSQDEELVRPLALRCAVPDEHLLHAPQGRPDDEHL